MDIEISQEVHSKLDKYCNSYIRPAKMELVVDRCIRPFYSHMAKAWCAEPRLVPDFLPIPEKATMKIKIFKPHADLFHNTLKRFNEKTGMILTPCQVATWLCECFVKVMNIDELNKYKMEFGHAVKR